jgi:hypothetical protein
VWSAVGRVGAEVAGQRDQQGPEPLAAGIDQVAGQFVDEGVAGGDLGHQLGLDRVQGPLTGRPWASSPSSTGSGIDRRATARPAVFGGWAASPSPGVGR